MRTKDLYADYPQKFEGNLNYHVDDNLSAGGFVAIWVLLYFFGFCCTMVLLFVVKRSLKGNAPGPGMQILYFNLVGDALRAPAQTIFLIFTGGDLSVMSMGGLFFHVFVYYIVGFAQINGIVAMFHLRRKMMQDQAQLIKDRVHPAKKYIMISVGAAILLGLCQVLTGLGQNWAFNQKWYVEGSVISDAHRVMVATTIMTNGYKSGAGNVVGLLTVFTVLIFPIFYCLFCLVPVLRLLNKFRKMGICSTEMQSMARLSITFYLIFVCINLAAIVYGLFMQYNTNPDSNTGRGATYVVSESSLFIMPYANVVACYVFFPRFRAYGIALFYDLIGKKDLAREVEAITEKELEDMDQTMTKGVTDLGTTAGTETANTDV